MSSSPMMAASAAPAVEEAGEEDEEAATKEMFVGATASIFAEADRSALFASIDVLTAPATEDPKRLEAVEAVASTVRKYQALPAVMDGDLPVAVERLVTFGASRLQQKRDAGSRPKVHRDAALDAAFAAVYEICAARGVKGVMRLFPHRIKDLEPCYVTLTNLDSAEIANGTWRTRYALLLWLRMLMLNPFDVATIAADGTSFVAAVVSVCTDLLDDAGPTQAAAALCLAAVLTRRDVDPSHLTGFVAHAKGAVAAVGEDHRSVFAATGALATLAGCFKVGDRALMRQVATRVLEDCVTPCFEEEAHTSSRALRKAAVKLASRGGCALLKPRLATWCYARGKRDLLGSMSSSAEEEEEEEEASSSALNNESNDDDVVVDGLEASPEVLENVVDHLLQGARDAETRTRWSAAKGLGRVSSRLSRDVADDVVGCLVEVFAEDGGDEAMHGACLALAECARLGVLLPSRMGDVMGALSVALRYDAKMSHAASTSNSGAHVRDAACYVAWTLARAFDPEVLAPHLERLAVNLVLAALFDRELHVRRAASAALQENVGRQGHAKFRRGIELLTLADFFALANRDHAFTVVAPAIAALGEPYASAIWDHVVEDRLRHWDADLRVAAARALGELAKVRGGDDFDELLFFFGTKEGAPGVLRELLPVCQSRELAQRHGALLGAAEAILASSSSSGGGGGWSPEMVALVAETVPRLESARLYRGRGGESIRVGACRFIECVALARVPLPVAQQICLLDSLDESVVHALEVVRDAATAGIRALTQAYFGASVTPPSDRLMARTLEKYVGELRGARTASASRGWARALGSLPRRVLAHRGGGARAPMDAAIAGLAQRARRDDKVAGARDAETRRDALRGLRDLVAVLEDEDLTENRVARLFFDTYVESAEDYGVDKRGDVGSWARIEALHGGLELALKASRKGRPSTTTTHDAKPPPVVDDGTVVPALEDRIAACMGSPALLAARTEALPEPPIPLAWGSRHSEALIQYALKQLGEKLDSVRAVADAVLSRALLNNNNNNNNKGNDDVAAIPLRGQLRQALYGNSDVDGVKKTTVYERLARASVLAVYHEPIVAGLVASAGTGAANNAAATALRDHALSNVGAARGNSARLLGTLIDLVGAKSTRITLPAMRSIAALVDAKCFAALCAAPPPPPRHREEWAEQTLKDDRVTADDERNAARRLAVALVAEARRKRTTKDVKRNCAIADALLATVIYGAVWAPTSSQIALAEVLRLLGGPYPRARAYVAEQLYARCLELALADDVAEVFAAAPDFDFAQTLLGEQTWDGAEVADLRTAARRIAQRFKIEALYTAATQAVPDDDEALQTNKDDLESYAALVKDAGY